MRKSRQHNHDGGVSTTVTASTTLRLSGMGQLVERRRSAMLDAPATRRHLNGKASRDSPLSRERRAVCAWGSGVFRNGELVQTYKHGGRVRVLRQTGCVWAARVRLGCAGACTWGVGRQGDDAPSLTSMPCAGTASMTGVRQGSCRMSAEMCMRVGGRTRGAEARAGAS